MTEALFAGMDQLFTLPTMATMLLGVVAGVIASAIPGFTITMAIVLTLPLTFTMAPLQGVLVKSERTHFQAAAASSISLGVW